VLVHLWSSFDEDRDGFLSLEVVSFEGASFEVGKLGVRLRGSREEGLESLLTSWFGVLEFLERSFLG